MKKPIAFILVITILLSALCIPAVAATSSAVPPTVATAKDILPAYTGTNSGITYTDTYNDCILMTVTGTTKTAYSAFLDAFESNGSGYTKVLRGHKPLEMTGTSANITAIYRKGTDYLVNTIWIPSSNEVKATVEPLNGLDLSVFLSKSKKDSTLCSPLVIQIGLDGVTTAYTKGDQSITDENSMHSGMSYAFRTSDGRYVVYDGGGDGGSLDANHAARIYETLKFYNKRTDGIVIAAWVITHPHTDHMGGFMAFTKYYLNNPTYNYVGTPNSNKNCKVTLERVICNLPNLSTQTFTEEGRTQSLATSKITLYNTRLEELKAQGVEVFKAHAGQKYYFDNLTIEILFTFDLLSPKLPDYCFTGTDAYAKMKTKRLLSNQKAVSGEAGNESDFTNTFSIISQVTLNVDADTSFRAMMTGDASCFSIETVNRMYGSKMKSDFLQVPHHGLTQMNQGSSSCTDPHYHELQVDLFFGDNTSKAQLDQMYPNADSTTTVQAYVKAYSSYTSSGYGYVKAKYILIPTDLLHASTYIDGEPGDDNWNAADYTDESFTDTADPVNEYVNIAEGDSRRDSWNPVIHLQEEVEDNSGYIRVARNLVNTFILNADGTVTNQQTKATITANMETPDATDTGGYTLIYDAADLKAINNNAAGKYKLAKDIYFTEDRNYALCYSNAFTGTFDGNGHTIYVSGTANWTNTPAFLFATLGDGAVVKNLTIDGFTATVAATTGKNCGVLAQSVSGTVTIDNVHIVNTTITDNTATTATGANIVTNIGGFIGDVGAATVTVSNSSFDGTIGTDADRTTGSAGGFFGRAGQYTAVATKVSLTNCQVSGSISHVTNAGGFAGSVNTSSAGSFTVEGCTNNAALEAGSAGCAGGIAGTVQNAPNMTVTDCTNSGDVVGYNAGGMVGAVSGSSSVTVEGFANSGSIEVATAGTGSVSAVIGTVGTTGSSVSAKINVSNVTNTGAVTGDAANAGILAGQVNSTQTVKFENCTNAGTYLGDDNFVGTSTSTTTVTGSTSKAVFQESMQAFLHLESEVKMGVGYKLTNMESLNPADHLDRMGLLIWSASDAPTEENATYANCTYICSGAIYNAAVGRFETSTLGIAAKELGDQLTFRAYYRNGDGSYSYSRLISNYSPKTYCYNQIRNNPNDQERIDLMVAILNYGAAAQLHFGYRTNSLMNAELSAEQKAMTWDGSLVRSDYSVPNGKDAAFVRDAAVTSRGGYLLLEGAISYGYYAAVNFTPESATVYYWTEEQVRTVDALTLGNAVSSEAMTWNASKARWECSYEKQAAKEMFKTVYACMVFEKADGTMVYSGVIGYSPERYAYINQNDGDTNAELAKRLVVYGDAARTFFAAN